MRSFLVVLATLCLVSFNDAFVTNFPTNIARHPGMIQAQNDNNNNNDNNNQNSGSFFSNMIQDFQDMASNIDDVVDDFVFKRMGAGEQWYGKRKYKPSGSVQGDYNGMGKSDKYKIDVARFDREKMLEKKEEKKRMF